MIFLASACELAIGDCKTPKAQNKAAGSIVRKVRNPREQLFIANRLDDLFVDGVLGGPPRGQECADDNNGHAEKNHAPRKIEWHGIARQDHADRMNHELSTENCS